MSDTQNSSLAPGDTSKLTFHPDFTKPSDAAIFQANDGTCFRFSLPLLAALSPFFKNVEAFPEQVKVLPSAPSKALLAVFALILGALNGVAPKLDVAILRSVPDVVDILSIADVYDLPLVHLALVKLVTLSFPKDPFLVFAVAAVCKDEQAAKWASTRTLGYDIDFMPADYRHLLEKSAPVYLLRLIELHFTRFKATESLRKRVDDIATHRGHDGFFAPCGYPTTCVVAKQYAGDWPKLKGEMMRRALVSAGASCTVLATEAFHCMVAGSVDCGRCRERLYNAFEVAKAESAEGLNRTEI